MLAFRHHPQHLPLPVVGEADRASRRIRIAAVRFRELESRVRIDDRLVQADDGVQPVGVFPVVLGYEDHARHYDAAVAGGGGVADLATSEADVGGEEEGGEDEEEAEGDGQGVAEADVGEAVGGGRGRRRWEGEESGHWEVEEQRKRGFIFFPGGGEGRGVFS